MPTNSTIVIIRHGEKPASGTGLDMMGQARAQAYSIYLNNYPSPANPIKFNYLFASEDSGKSSRPKLTITPFSEKVNLPINDSYLDDQYEELAQELNNSTYNNQQILICWHHGKMLDLAAALGVNPKQLPASANWPHKWHGEVFGWLLQLSFDANGKIIPASTFCINQKLMFDDHGVNPPDGK